MAKELIHIGTIEFVSLPDDQIERVPAKIDTGADNSAIWASNIHLDNGKLVFNFFAPGSMFYQPEPVVTSAFRTTIVRNSFGQREFRYKIKLKVKVGNHTLTRWFSLADRSRNNFPILLGKNFLKKTFVVDVAQRHLHTDQNEPNDVLVLTRFPKKATTFFSGVSKLNKSPMRYSCVNYDALEYVINGTDTHVFNNQDEYKDLAHYSYVYFKNHVDFPECAAAAAEYLHFKGRPFIDRELLTYISTSKLSEYTKLACYGLPVPQSISANTKVLKSRFTDMAEILGLPFVLKEIASDRGRNNYLIAKQADYDKILSKAPENFMYLAQKYIPNDGFYRVYVLGKDIALVIKRTSTIHKDRLKSHLNKPSGSHNAAKVPSSKLPNAVQDLSLKAAQTLERQFAGVDLVKDKITKKWYILEVNNAPQILSGSFHNDKTKMVAEFFDKELNQ